MKFLAFLLFLGISEVISRKDLETPAYEALSSFLRGAEKVPSLREAMNMPYPELDEVEDDVKTELMKELRDDLDSFIEKVEDQDETMKANRKEQVNKVRGEINKLGVGVVEDKAREVLERIKLRVEVKLWEWINKLLRKQREEQYLTLPSKSKRTLRDALEWLRKKLSEEVIDFQELIKGVKEKFGEYSKVLKILMKNFTKETIKGIKDYLDELLDRKDSTAVKRSYEKNNKTKKYIKETRDNLEHRFSSLPDWLQKVYKRKDRKREESYSQASLTRKRKPVSKLRNFSASTK